MSRAQERLPFFSCKKKIHDALAVAQLLYLCVTVWKAGCLAAAGAGNLGIFLWTSGSSMQSLLFGPRRETSTLPEREPVSRRLVSYTYGTNTYICIAFESPTFSNHRKPILRPVTLLWSNLGTSTTNTTTNAGLPKSPSHYLFETTYRVSSRLWHWQRWSLLSDCIQDKWKFFSTLRIHFNFAKFRVGIYFYVTGNTFSWYREGIFLWL